MDFNKMRLSYRLGGNFLLIIIFTIAVAIVSILYMNSLSSLTTKLYRHPYSVSTAVLRIDGNIVRMHRSMKDVALAKDEAGINKAVTKVADYEKLVFKDFDVVKDRFFGKNEKVTSAIKIFADWKPIRDEVIAYMESGERAKAADITKNKGATHVKLLNETINGFVTFAGKKASEFYSHS